jgi:phosphoribosylanthranilate isomerase
MKIKVKICGITDPAALHAAAQAGARYAGFVFYPPSPRYLSLESAHDLVRQAPTTLQTVGLFVDPNDAMLERVLARVPLGMIQLHGQETPARVAAIKSRFHLPIIKAIPVATAADVNAAYDYLSVADILLFDAKAPPEARQPGGNALAFDWRLLADQSWPKPWLLAGGLTVDNVAEAVQISRARGIDVSSGVEDRPGHKDPAKIKALMAAIATI